LATPGAPLKLDEDMGDGVTRREAALAAVEQGMRSRHVAGAAGVDRSTIVNWRKRDPDFSAAYVQAQSRGVGRLLGRRAAGLLCSFWRRVTATTTHAPTWTGKRATTKPSSWTPGTLCARPSRAHRMRCSGCSKRQQLSPDEPIRPGLTAVHPWPYVRLLHRVEGKEGFAASCLAALTGQDPGWRTARHELFTR